MAGEDQIVRIENGIPVKRTVEDNLHTYSNDALAVSVGDAVYQDTTSDTKVGIADADNASARPPIGVVSEVLTSTSCVVCHFGGIVTGLSGLTRGSQYWLTTTGTSGNTLTTTTPTTNKYLIGVALSATELLVTSVPTSLESSGGGGTGLSVSEQGVSVGTGFTTLNFTGEAVAVTDAGGNQANIAITAVAPDHNSIWVGTVNQDPLEDETDYFDDGYLDPIWDEWDVGSNTTISETISGLEILRTSSSTNLSGLVQTTPAFTSYAITAEIELDMQLGVTVGAGIIVGENLVTNPTTGNIWSLFVEWDTTASELLYRFVYWDDYATVNTVQYSDTIGSHSSRFFLRLFVNTSTTKIRPLVSRDGRRWISLGPEVTYTDTLANIGFACRNNTGGGNLTMYSRMFRVDETADPFLPVGGFISTSVPSTLQDGPRDVDVNPGNTVNYFGWPDRAARLIKVHVYSAVPGSIGTYTFSLSKGASGFATNLLSAATFDLTSLTAYTPTEVTLTSTTSNLIFTANEVWRAQFVSNNAGLDAEGVYFTLTWLVM